MKYLTYLFPIAAAIFLAFFSLNAEKNPLDNDMKKISYALGYQIAQGIKSQSSVSELDSKALQSAISDVMAGRPTLLTEEEVQQQVKKWYEMQVEARKKQATANKAATTKFLAKNKTKPGIETTASGLQYKIIKPGKGTAPTPADKVKVHYAGTLIDGSEFDSSYKRNAPATFGLTQVIKGWTEGLQLVKPGGKVQLFVPPELGYGPATKPGIPGNSVLIFDVELLEVNPK